MVNTYLHGLLPALLLMAALAQAQQQQNPNPLLPTLTQPSVSPKVTQAPKPASKGTVRRPATKAKASKSTAKPGVARIERAIVTSVSDTVKGRFIVPQVQLPDAAAAARVNLGLVDVALGEDLEDVPQPLTVSTAIEQAHTEFEGKKSDFTESRYEVLYNDHGLLSVEFTSEYRGAYPSTVKRHATFDLRTGRLMAVRDLVADTLALQQRWQQSISRRVTEHLRTLPEEYPQLATDTNLLADVKHRLYWNDSTSTVELQAGEPRLYDFAVTSFGLVLYYDFGFPHLIEALQPDSDYQLTYADIKLWLKPKGPLSFTIESSPPSSKSATNPRG
ncbi:hypothetical protein [uncultured Hymenobacter sp.]|uniref:hypothetical protein n=1 Tax=uncultured Hymenobacter sp. TaxID=170016 RepID=UPI0035C9B78F